MPAITPSAMRAIARDLMNDSIDGAEDRASRNDGKLIARFVETGTASRAALDAAIDEIEKSSLGMDKKKEALRFLEKYKDESATGFAGEMYGVDEALLDRLAYHGVNSPAALLEEGETTAKRQHLAINVGVDEKTIRRLVKQADLMRVDGVDGKTAAVLIQLGIDSVPELANRSASNLQAKMADFASSNDGYVMSFTAPDVADVEAWKAQAGGLDRAVEFGSIEYSFAGLSVEKRLELFSDVWDSDILRTRDYDGTMLSLFAHLGVDDMMGPIEEMRDIGLSELSYELEHAGADVPMDVLRTLSTYDELLDWVEQNIGAAEADALGNGGADMKDPTIELIKLGNQTVGARITFGRIIDGDHDYNTTFIYDHHARRITGRLNHGYEMHDELESVGVAEELSGSATSRRMKELGEKVAGLKHGDTEWQVWARDLGGDLTPESFRDKNHIRHDNIAIRPLGDNTDDLLVTVTDGLSQADKARLLAAVDSMRDTLTDLQVVTVDGGYWGDAAHDSVYLVGTDEDGNVIQLRNQLDH